MNPHSQYPYSLTAMWLSVYRNKSLIWQMIKREIAGSFRGSFLGVMWLFLQPLIMLCVYTFVFCFVLKTTWRGNPESGTMSFAIILFAGLTVHTLFAECINRAPTLILGNTNLVKRVVFPLEVLPIVTIGVAFFNFLVSLLILFGAMLLSGHDFHLTLFYTPLVIFPLFFMTLGITWIMSSTGVYLRDLGHAAVLITTILLFLSPVLFPMELIPEQFRNLIYLNPLTFIINQVRAVMLWGQPPDWFWLTVYSAVGVLVAWLGFCFFQYTRKGFCDVL